MTVLRSLSQTSFDDVLRCGGKASRLGEAMRLGCPVLPGVILPTDLFHRFMRQGGLQGEITSILSTMQPTAVTHFQAAEWAIQAAFDVRRMPDEVSTAIREAWNSFGGAAVAVRSSATSEDSPYQSFVGQHATCLNVNNEEEAIDAVIRCWKSLFSAKALSYAQRFGVDLLSSSMAVLMQPMIAPDEQGALFTVNPITGDPDVFLLEIVNGPHTGLHELRPYERRSGEQPFWSRLRELGLLLDEHWLAYQALEWAIADGDLYLLRVRPITVAPPYIASEGVEVNSSLGPLELVRQPDCTPRALPPFTWYHRSRTPGLRAAYFRHTSRLFESFSGRDEYYLSGYLYTRWQRFPVPASDDDLGAIRRATLSFGRLRAARSLDREFRALWRDRRPRLVALAQENLSALSNADLSRGLRDVISIGEAFWTQCGRLGNSPQALRDILHLLHREWVGEHPDSDALLWSADDRRSHSLETLSDLARAEYADDDARENAFQGFFQQHRHLYLKGRPLAEWQDISAIQVDQAAARAEWLTHAVRDGPSVRQQHAAQADKRAALERHVLERLDRFRRAVYRYVLRLARRYAPLRFDRQEPVLLCRLLEHDIVTEVGHRLQTAGLIAAPHEAFLLGYREIIEWLEGSAARDEIVRLVVQRRDLHRRWWRYAPPDIVAEEAEDDDIEIDTLVSAEDVMHGRPISPGRASGRAHVINSLGEATNILPGEVLVCRDLLFELSPLFSIISAVVAENGGLLDHASVLAREFGVPTVFSVKDATRIIRTGEELRVDAHRGIVTRHRPEQIWESL